MLEDSAMRLSAIGLIVTFGIGLLLMPLAAKAQHPGKVYRIGILSAGSPPLPAAPTPNLDAFRHQLRELGWIEGQNMVIERRWAERQFERLPTLATELVQQQVDLLLAACRRENAMANPSSTIDPEKPHERIRQRPGA
jgi:hypothetical protein